MLQLSVVLVCLCCVCLGCDLFGQCQIDRVMYLFYFLEAPPEILQDEPPSAEDEEGEEELESEPEHVAVSDEEEKVSAFGVHGSFELPDSPLADDDVDAAPVASGPGVSAQSALTPAVKCIFCGQKSTMAGVDLACFS